MKTGNQGDGGCTEDRNTETDRSREEGDLWVSDMRPLPGGWITAHSCFQLGYIFVRKHDKEPDPHANWPITQLMVSLMELIQQ